MFFSDKSSIRTRSSSLFRLFVNLYWNKDFGSILVLRFWTCIFLSWQILRRRSNLEEEAGRRRCIAFSSTGVYFSFSCLLYFDLKVICIWECECESKLDTQNQILDLCSYWISLFLWESWEIGPCFVNYSGFLTWGCHKLCSLVLWLHNLVLIWAFLLA